MSDVAIASDAPAAKVPLCWLCDDVRIVARRVSNSNHREGRKPGSPTKYDYGIPYSPAFVNGEIVDCPLCVLPVATSSPLGAEGIAWRATLFGDGYANVSLDDADRQYRRLAKMAHPDKGGAAEAFRKLTDAIEAARREFASPPQPGA